MLVTAEDKSGRCVRVPITRRCEHPVTIVDLDGPSAQDWREVAEDYQQDGESLSAVMIVADTVQFWFKGGIEQ